MRGGRAVHPLWIQGSIVDIWLPGTQADNWGVQQRTITVV
jgi:hypothetical protein